MDPELAAVYRDGYAAATARIMASAAISTAARASRAAVKSTNDSSVVGRTREQRAAEMTLFGFIWNLLFLTILLVTWPFRFVSSSLLVPMLGGIWSFLWSVLVFFAWIGLAAAVFIFIINNARLREWLAGLGETERERYDDFALGNDFLLHLEHGYASFRRAMYDRWLSLRYNETTDNMLWYWNELYLLPDTIQRLLTRYWGKTAVCVALAGWLWYSWNVPSIANVPMQQLPPRLATDVPGWVINYDAMRKKDGSNSHYSRQPEPPAVILYEEWVRAVGNDKTMSPEPAVETQTVILAPTTETATVTVTETRNESISTVPLPDDKLAAAIASTKTTSRKEKPTDYWAPLKGRTKLGKDEIMWCRVCQQYHGYELPY